MLDLSCKLCKIKCQQGRFEMRQGFLSLDFIYMVDGSFPVHVEVELIEADCEPYIDELSYLIPHFKVERGATADEIKFDGLHYEDINAYFPSFIEKRTMANGKIKEFRLSDLIEEEIWKRANEETFDYPYNDSKEYGG